MYELPIEKTSVLRDREFSNELETRGRIWIDREKSRVTERYCPSMNTERLRSDDIVQYSEFYSLDSILLEALETPLVQSLRIDV